MYPDDTHKDLATVLSYMAGRTLTKEEIWKAMGLPRSTYYDQLEKGTLITADNLRRAAANLGINRAELLTRYRLIEPEEVASLAEEIAGLRRPLPFPPSRTGVITGTNPKTATTTPETRATVSRLPPPLEAPPL
jgi:transcriptional regulator with XRE-family HTH domain